MILAALGGTEDGDAHGRSTVSVVVPTHNNVDELARCLASLQVQDRPPDRVIVCVDGSTDGTLEHLAAMADSSPLAIHTRTHPGNVHRGRAATRNLALDLLDADYVWFVIRTLSPRPTRWLSTCRWWTVGSARPRGRSSTRTPTRHPGPATSTLVPIIAGRIGRG